MRGKWPEASAWSHIGTTELCHQIAFGSSPHAATSELCDLGQVTLAHWASVSLHVNWGKGECLPREAVPVLNEIMSVAINSQVLYTCE